MTYTTKRRIRAEYKHLTHAKSLIGTVRELAKKYGISRQRVYQIVNELDSQSNRNT
jgi:Mor family transcriptional regulator